MGQYLSFIFQKRRQASPARGLGLLAAGLCAGLSLSLPWFSAWLLPAVGALLLHALRLAPGRRGRGGRLARFGCFTAGFLCGGLFWIGQGLYRPPANGLLSAGVLWLGIIGLQWAVYLLCFALLQWWPAAAGRGPRPWRLAWGLATAWSLAEALRGIGPLALPWGMWGHGAIDHPLLRGFYPLGGSVLVAWLQWMLAALALEAVRRWRKWRRGFAVSAGLRRSVLLPAGWAGLLALAVALWPIDWTRPVEVPLRVRIVHTHWPEEHKYQPASQALALSQLEQAAQMPGADLVVFPELFLVQRTGLLGQAFRQRVAQAANAQGTALLFGAPAMAVQAQPPHREAGLHNSLVLIDEQGHAHSYAKRQLLPFTEYLPSSAWVRWIGPLLYRYPMADMVAGAPRQPPLVAHGVPLGPLICSELAAPLLSAQQSVQAQLLVSPSSDSWIASPLYLQQAHVLARVRAAELQKPLVRANNVGISSFIDHRGRTLAAWSGEPGSGQWPMTPRTGHTPYAAMTNGIARLLDASPP